mmetsp:Transcript_42473/g.131144  ORF Transcript_42473/g.131144 Transcript_42473/m.131144 type:complete len:425 (-) Transcript_42473:39-1313(-)
MRPELCLGVPLMRTASAPRASTLDTRDSKTIAACSSSRCSESAAPKPTMPGALSVPGRISPSNDPPAITGSMAATSFARTATAPMPVGPLILWAVTATASYSVASTSTLHSAWHASACTSAPCARHSFAMAAPSRSVPSSWFTTSNASATFAHGRLSSWRVPRPSVKFSPPFLKALYFARSFSSAAMSRWPSGRTGTASARATLPFAASFLHTSMIEGCATDEYRSTAGLPSASSPVRSIDARPPMAMLFASVPPDVKASLNGVARLGHRNDSSWWRTPSTAARHTRPIVCRLLGLPTGARLIASCTAGSMIVAAAESMYTVCCLRFSAIAAAAANTSEAAVAGDAAVGLPSWLVDSDPGAGLSTMPPGIRPSSAAAAAACGFLLIHAWRRLLRDELLKSALARGAPTGTCRLALMWSNGMCSV